MAGLYIHIPFCNNKCPYCDFVSGSFPLDVRVRYLNALSAEINLHTGQKNPIGLSFETLYVGGGTPSTTPAKYLARVIEEALERFTWSSGDHEITVEANPESVTKDWLAAMRSAGANRLSLGVQSLSERGLSALGRRHTVPQAINAFKEARDAGFSAIGVDLIYGWPGDSLKDFKKTLEDTFTLGPEHISCYELTVEKGTRLDAWIKEGAVELPDEETVYDLTDMAEDMMAGAGYEQYEISNFARTGFRCRHNLSYWESKPYIGLGCSAASYIPPVRCKNERDVLSYIEAVRSGRIPITEREGLDSEARFREAVVMNLRLVDGIELKAFKRQWGVDVLDYYKKDMHWLLENRLVGPTAERLFLTRKGRRLANLALSRLV